MAGNQRLGSKVELPVGLDLQLSSGDLVGHDGYYRSAI